jgi:putative endonuclease
MRCIVFVILGKRATRAHAGDPAQEAAGGVNLMYEQRNTKQPAVYIVASRRNGTIYTGVTSGLFGRIAIHQQDLIDGFTKRYGVHRLVYFELFDTMPEAISREKQIKKYGRQRKIALIETKNPAWTDLYVVEFGA